MVFSLPTWQQAIEVVAGCGIVVIEFLVTAALAYLVVTAMRALGLLEDGE